MNGEESYVCAGNEYYKYRCYYKKGDYDSISKIAVNYPTAVENARKTIANLLPQGLPGTEDTDDRNQWLCTNCLTFSTVYEAIEFLESL